MVRQLSGGQGKRVPFGGAGSKSAPRTVAFCLLALLTGMAPSSCSKGLHYDVANVSVIGPRPVLADPDRSPPDAGSALLLAATTQGLVRLDGNGEIDPGLAERWIVTGDGLSQIFRIKRTQWSNGHDVDAEEVAADLNRMIRSGNRLAPLIAATTEISGMTERVVEIRSSSPQPRLLQLLAQSDAAVMLRGMGSGPLRLASSKGGIFHLKGRLLNGADGEEERITLRGEDVTHAVIRYKQGRAHLVANGSFADLPIARAIRPDQSELRFDNANGLFGFAILSREGFLSSAANRSALSMAVNRERLLQVFRVDGWRQAVSIIPSQFDLPKPPAAQDWVALRQDDRISKAAGLLASWRAAHGAPPVLRIGMPKGPGARVLFAALQADWARIGVKIILSDMGSADLRLIDEVAPESSANWYLTRLSCGHGYVCTSEGEAAIKQAHLAPGIKERVDLFAKADAAFTTAAPFIPIATPLRWALVSPDLVGWKENLFAAHPLAYMRAIKR